ncbi:MAG: hypothetical protein ACRC7S_00005 [Cetobacterium sp.]
MNTKVKLPNGVEIECAEGAIKAFDLLVNLKQQGFMGQPTHTHTTIDNSNADALQNEIEVLRKENQELKDNMIILGSQNDDMESFQENYNKLLDENEKLKAELIEKENTIKNNNKSIYELEDSLTIKNNEITKLKTEIDLLKLDQLPQEEIIREDLPPITEIMEKKAVEMIERAKTETSQDFDPNKPEDAEWLRRELGQKIETPVVTPPVFTLPTPKPIEDIEVIEPTTVQEDGEYIDGLRVIRNQARDIIQIEEFELTPPERMSLKFKISTVDKVYSNRKMIEEGKKESSMAQGWN